MLLMVSSSTFSKTLLTVSPGIHPLKLSFATTVHFGKILLIFLYPTNVVTTADFSIFSNTPNILNKVQVSLQAAQEPYAMATGQANNNVWYEERKHRIAASKFVSQPTLAFIRAIFHPVNISNLPFVKYGRENARGREHMTEIGRSWFMCEPIPTSFRGISRSCCF